MAEGTCSAPGWTLLRVLAMMGCSFAILFCTWFIWAYHRCTRRRNPSNRHRFTILRRRRVRPIQPLGKQISYPLSALDKLLCPMIIINMHFFYEKKLDADRLAASLARLISRHPFLAGTVRGYLSWVTLTCDDSGCELVEQCTDLTKDDVYFGSPALKRHHHFWPNGFGAGRAYDVALAFAQFGAPTLRVTITYLADGTSSLSLSVGHTVMDAKSIMKIVELWAADTRGELSYHDEPLPSPATPLPSPKDLSPAKPRMVLVRSPSSANGSAEMLLTARELDELATAWSPPARLSLWEVWVHLRQGVYQTSYMCYLWLFVPLISRTFFFSDDEVTALKKQVMADIRRRQEAAAVQQEQEDASLDESGASLSASARVGYGARGPIASFVSSNDVITAAWWKILSGLSSIPTHLGGSSLRMNVDIRTIISSPMVRSRLASVDGDTSTSTSTSTSSPASSFVQVPSGAGQSTASGGKQQAEGGRGGEGALPESFFLGNGVLQVSAYHPNPADAPVSDLAQAIRHSISSLTPDLACTRLGDLKQKIRHMDNLGILLGPVGCDWEMDRDVIVSSFNPLHIDNDFGAGQAYFYDLDLLPSLTMYQHIHRGVSGGKPGLFIQATLPHKCMEELLQKYQRLLPPLPPSALPKDQAPLPPQAPAPSSSPPAPSSQSSPQDREGDDGPLSGSHQHQQGPSPLPSPPEPRQGLPARLVPSPPLLSPKDASEEGAPSGDEQGRDKGVSLSPPSLPVWPRSAAS